MPTRRPAAVRCPAPFRLAGVTIARCREHPTGRHISFSGGSIATARLSSGFSRWFSRAARWQSAAPRPRPRSPRPLPSPSTPS